jgi:rhomboid protease GluP
MRPMTTMNRVSSSQRYRITIILIALNVAMYVYTSVVGGDFLNTNIDMIAEYGQVNAFILYGGITYYYQLFSSLFVHVSIIHLAGNMLFLLIFGLRGEEMFSLPEFLAVYFLSGLAGNVLSLFLMDPWIPSAGASGAIFGMFGACSIYARRSIGQSVVGALIFGFFLLMISTGENVNIFAHIGGLAAGLAIGYVIARNRKTQTGYQVNRSYMTPF